MTYQTAYKLLVAAYKSAKGVMPQGIDMLKLKMKARQKVIDAKKVIKVNFDKGNNWMKAKPQSTKPEGIIPVTVKGKTTKMTPEGIMKMLTGKGKVAETEAQMLARMKKQNKESVARLKEKKEKSLGEKLKDYDGDPDAMAAGGKVKKPFKSKVVDFLGGPAVVGAELGLSGLLEVYNILGMPLMKDGGKVKKKRKHNDNIDDEDIGEGKSKERFLRVMPEVEDIPRSDGIMELATGGMTNIGNTYDNNPTLQSQYPNKQDYLDLFAQQTTTTPQYATAYQSTGSIDPINPILPIIPIPESGDGGGGPPPGPRGNPNFDYETEAYGLANLTPEQKGITQEEQDMLDKEKSGLMNLLSLSPTYQISKFVFDKAKAGKKKLDDYFAKKAKEKAEREEKAARELARQMQDSNRANKTGGYQSTYSQDTDFMEGDPNAGGRATSATSGST